MMKIPVTVCALLLTLPLLAVTACDRNTAYAGQNTQQQNNRLDIAVNDALQRDAALAQSDITVVVSSQGQVTLSGTVTSVQDKKRASDIAKQVTGSKVVNNGLAIVTPGNPN